MKKPPEAARLSKPFLSFTFLSLLVEEKTVMARRILMALCVCLLSACGGGGGGGTVAPSNGSGSGPSTGGSSPGKTQSIQLNVHIPGGAATASSKRHAQFVVSSTAGVLVQVYASSDTGHTTVLGTTATNVSPGSTACGGLTGARTCSVAIAAPGGTDDFVFTTYDQPPNGPTSFPGNANVLATGNVFDQAIVTASANVVNVSLGGTVFSLQGEPFQYAQIASWGPNSYTFAPEVLDADANIIIGSYNVPITITATEHGGSGLTSLTTAGPGGTGSPSVTIHQSSDVVTVLYAGGGTPGYFTSFALSAGSGITATSSFGPLYITSTSPAFAPSTSVSAPATLNLTSAGQSAIINIGEVNVFSALATYGSCANVVSITAPSSGSTQSSTITADSGGGTCTQTYQDNDGNLYRINITAPSNTSANVAVPGSTLAYYSVGTPGVVISTAAGVQVGGFGTPTSADYIGLDDTADVFVLTQNSNNNTTPGTIYKYTPSGTGYPQSYALSSATYTMTDPDHVYLLSVSGPGEVLALEVNFTVQHEILDIWDPGHTGTPSRTITYNGSSALFGGLSHDGTAVVAYYTPCGTNTCIKYDVIPPGSSTPSRTVSETLVNPSLQGVFAPNYLAIGPDGTLYVTEFNFLSNDPNVGLYIYPPSGPERYVLNTHGAASPQGVDLDAAGNIYVVTNNGFYDTGARTGDTRGYVNVLSPDGGTILRSFGFGTFDNPYPLAVAADGTSFVGDFADVDDGALGGVYATAPSGFPSTSLGSVPTSVIITYNGTTETTGRARVASVSSHGSAHAGGFALRRLHH
jgi:hypothetical protein